MLDIPSIVVGNSKLLADDSSPTSLKCALGGSEICGCHDDDVVDIAAFVSLDAAVLLSWSSAGVICCMWTTGSHLGMAMAEFGSGLKSSL